MSNFTGKQGIETEGAAQEKGRCPKVLVLTSGL